MAGSSHSLQPATRSATSATRSAAPATRSAAPATRSFALVALALGCLVLVVGASPAVGTGTAASPESGQANVTVTTETADGSMSVAVRIANAGEATGRYAIELVESGGEVVARRDLRVPPNGTRQATFDAEPAGTTAYVVYVNDVAVERFTATAPTKSAASSERELPGPVVVSLLGGALLLVVGVALSRLS